MSRVGTQGILAVNEEAGLVPDSRPSNQESIQQSPGPVAGVMEAFIKICQRWRLSDDQQMILLGYPNATSFFNQLKLGHMPLISQDTKDRIGYVLHISIGLGAIYNDVEEAEL